MSFCRVPMRNLSNGCPLVLLLRDSDTKRSSMRLCEWVVPGCDCVNHTCCVLLLLGVCVRGRHGLRVESIPCFIPNDRSKKRLIEDTEDWQPRTGTTQSRSFRILAQLTGTDFSKSGPKTEVMDCYSRE